MRLRAQRSQRDEVIATSHKLALRTWVANHDGNVSLRLDENRFLTTPTATAKADVSDSNLIEVDLLGQRVAGVASPFSEIAMHLAVFEERDDVRAVIHAHPPYATALACTGSNAIERPFIAEAVVSVGPLIPTLPFVPPGAESVRVLRSAARTVDTVLLANHGVFSWGPNLELAFLRLELVEHLARIATLAQATGGVQPLPESALESLLTARSKAGLGHAADRALDFIQRPVVACAPAPHTKRATIEHSSENSSRLAAIIREELAGFLGDPGL